MNKVIILVGDSGCGKDYLLSLVQDFSKITVIKRYMSRNPRNSEKDSISSIFSVDIDAIKQLDYYYEGVQSGNWYGFIKEDLINALKMGTSPIVIASNYNVFLKLCEDFGNDNVVPFFIYSGIGEKTLVEWRELLLARGSTLDEIAACEHVRDKYFSELYINHFNEMGANVILNFKGLTTNTDLLKQFSGLCIKNSIDTGPIVIKDNEEQIRKVN